MKNMPSIDNYIMQSKLSVRKNLRLIKQIIKKLAPKAIETIKYGMPTFVLNGNLVHFAAFKNHIGFYPTPSAIKTFKKDLIKYQTSKGAIQFPLDQPLPLALIKKIIKFRIKENILGKKR